MKNISHQKMLLVATTILLVSVFWRFNKLLVFPDSGINLQKGDFVKVQPKESITEKFTANRDGLSKIEVLLRTPGIKYENGDQMEMKILDENCQNTLRQGELKHSFLSSDNLYEFVFKKISNSAQKKYCLSATFQNKKTNAKAIQFFTMRNEKNQPLSIRPVYENKNIFGDLRELNQRISQYKPWFLKHYFLWFISLGFIFLSILLVVTLIII